MKKIEHSVYFDRLNENIKNLGINNLKESINICNSINKEMNNEFELCILELNNEIEVLEIEVSDARKKLSFWGWITFGLFDKENYNYHKNKENEEKNTTKNLNEIKTAASSMDTEFKSTVKRVVNRVLNEELMKDERFESVSLELRELCSNSKFTREIEKNQQLVDLIEKFNDSLSNSHKKIKTAESDKANKELHSMMNGSITGKKQSGIMGTMYSGSADYSASEARTSLDSINNNLDELEKLMGNFQSLKNHCKPIIDNGHIISYDLHSMRLEVEILYNTLIPFKEMINEKQNKLKEEFEKEQLKLKDILESKKIDLKKKVDIENYDVS